MPCRTDYVYEDRRYLFNIDTAKFIKYVTNLYYKNPVPKYVEETIKTGKLDLAPTLCAILRNIQNSDLKEFDKIVYNAKDPISRKLADWWEEHEKADRDRITREEQDKLDLIKFNDIVNPLSEDNRRVLRKYKDKI